MCNKGIHGDMCVCVCMRDRLGGVSGNGRHTNVSVCQRDRLRGASGKV